MTILLQLIIQEYLTEMTFRVGSAICATYLVLEFLYGVDGYVTRSLEELEKEIR